MRAQEPVKPEVRLVWNTPDPKRIIAIAARMCYSALPVSKLQDSLDQAEIDRMVRHILEVRHVSVLRHVVFAFTIEGVSRSFSHQFVRHHVGVDVEQRSQHYRREKQFSYNLPASVRNAMLCGAPEHDEEALFSAEDLYVTHMENSQRVYDGLIRLGVDKSEARQVLPNACETQMVVTMNLNAVMNVVSQRACRLNTPEILQVAVQIRRLVGAVMPEALEFLGPTCWSGGICYEGAKYFKACRRPWQSPTVLWGPGFPRRIEFVGIRNGKHFNEVRDNWEDSTARPAALPPRSEPSRDFQEAQGEDARNQS